MTRKDYKAIAQAIADNTDNTGEMLDKAGLVSALEDYFAYDNARFDGDKFAEACCIPYAVALQPH